MEEANLMKYAGLFLFSEMHNQQILGKSRSNMDYSNISLQLFYNCFIRFSDHNFECLKISDQRGNTTRLYSFRYKIINIGRRDVLIYQGKLLIYGLIYHSCSFF